MLIFRTHHWSGETGKRYLFRITLTDNVPDAGGVYVFVRRRYAFFLQPLYVGKASNFRSRLIGHERWMEAWWQRGATERHVLLIPGGRDRARIEEDLIRGLKPVMNDMLIPRGTLDAPRDRRLRLMWKLRNFWRFLPGFRGRARA